ncbi:MAG: hypothetical protein M1436_06260, partial [Acidobacteria bacterium]|nr:hypothetical protein [Acidobacteriota bacterium]
LQTAPPVSERIPVAGVLDVQFAAGRDGIHWERYGRSPYVRLGLPGELDSKGIYMGLGMIRRGGEIYQYYAGASADHGGGRGGSAIFRAVQRVDGFVSVAAGPSGGDLVTPHLRFAGRRLTLNVDTSASGAVRVEVLGADGKPVPGFEMSNCRPVIGNEIAYQVNWENAPDLSGMQQDGVSLRFELRNAHLYAFQFL